MTRESLLNCGISKFYVRSTKTGRRSNAYQLPNGDIIVAELVRIFSGDYYELCLKENKTNKVSYANAYYKRIKYFEEVLTRFTKPFDKNDIEIEFEFIDSNNSKFEFV